MKTLKLLTAYSLFSSFLLFIVITNIILLLKHTSLTTFFIVFVITLALNYIIENYLTKRLKELRWTKYF